jgi:predicted dehydrogenase
VVVGLGFVSRFWLPVLQQQDDVELHAAVEPDEERAARHELGCRVVHDLDDALDGANLVVNLTPPQFHRDVIERALRAGCDVLTEKPLAATLEDALALARLSEQSGHVLSVLQNRRFVPAIRRLREAVAEGTIGTPVLLCADMFMAPRHQNTFVELQERAPS